MKINRNSPLPLYYQLKLYIIDYIEKNNLKPGDRLPTDEELTSMFKLSRFTIRQAFSELEKEGRTERIQGKGSFVADYKVSFSVAWHLLGFSEDMEKKGYTVETEIIENKLIDIPKNIGLKLQASTSSKVNYIKRLRKLNEIPYLVDKVFVSTSLCPGLDQMDLNDKSLFSTFENIYGLSFYRAKRSLSIAEADKTVAKLLNIDPGSPLFFLTDLVFTEENIPIQFVETYIKDKHCEFVFDLYKQQPPETQEKLFLKNSVNPKIKKMPSGYQVAK